MKASIVAAAAVLAGGVSANRVHHRHAVAHELFEKRGHGDEVCTTILNTIYGSMSTYSEHSVRDGRRRDAKRRRIGAGSGRDDSWR